MKIKVQVFSLLLFLYAQPILAYTDLNLALGRATVNYEEQTDQIDQELTTQDTSIGIRVTEAFSYFDLGIESGSFSFARKFQDQSAEFQSDYMNVFTGLSWPLFTEKVELSLDFGIKFSSNDITLVRTVGATTDTYGFLNKSSTNTFSKIGIKTIFFKKVLLGAFIENVNSSVKVDDPSVSPEVSHIQSIYLTLGYRFGEKKIKPTIKAGMIYDIDCYEYGLKECLR